MSWGHGANQGLDPVVGNPSGATDVVASQEVFWLNKALIQAQSVLYKTALNPKVANYLETAFGPGYDAEAANDILSQWRGKDFSQLPPVVILSPEAMNGARGAYSAENNTIYLSSALLVKGSVTAARDVLLEEFGHYLDAQVNAQDGAGDEGELFSAIVRGIRLSPSELSRIKAEDDHGIMSLGGQLITIEKAAPTILTVTTTADQNNGVTTDGLSLREAILIANANPNTDYEIQLTGGLTYNLTANGVNENAGLTGDLDIASRNNVLYIVSVETQKATINASNLLNSDRVFDVRTNGRLSLQNVVVTGGLVGDYQDGGGIYVGSTGFLDLYNTTVSNNSAGDDGGGIYNFGTTYLRNGSIIRDNSATGVYAGGGGIFNNSGTLTIMNSTINNNSANGSGGGIVNNGISLLVINSTISNNTSSLAGGGIQNTVASSVALINTTISGNSSGDGGGINNGSGVLNARNSTITNNTAYDWFWSSAGGGITNGSGTVNLRNTIVAGNFRTLDSEGNNLASADLKRTFNGNNNNLIGTLTGAEGTIGTGTDIVNANVQLSPLQNNGGLTLTHIPLSGSPAINAGNNNQIPVDSEDLDGDGDTTEQLPFDARNLARISGGIVDIGAVEVQNTVVLPSITLAVSPASVTEDGTANLIYTFTRSGSTTSSLTVNYGITGTANATDYTGATPGTGKTITFATGASTATLTIDPTADTTVEQNETVILTLATGTGYTIGTTGEITGTILNDDTAVATNLAISATTGNQTEGNSGSKALTFTVTRSGTTTGSNNVNWAVTGTGTNPANAADFVGGVLPSGTVSFAAGQTSKVITINVQGDTTFEANETFTVTLSNPTNGAILTTGSAQGTIQNDDISLGGTFTGTTGNNTLNGTSGADTMIGLAGNDTYTVNNIGDVVVENPNEGTDTIKSDITYTLSNNVEKLTLNGNSNLNGTGNELNNTLTGNNGNNSLTGLDGNDRLDGKAGADTMIGGLGNDSYTIDNVGDVIIENLNEGTDSVRTTVNYTLSANVENLTLNGSASINGTGNNLKNRITGNTGANILNGGAGADTLAGKAGADTFVFRFGESTTTALDRITDFAIGIDKIDLLTQGGAAMNAPVAFSRAADSTTSNINTVVTNVFADANGATVGNQALGINSAALVKAGSATYLFVNDGTAGFQSANDLVVNLTGITGTLPALGAIAVNSFFV